MSTKKSLLDNLTLPAFKKAGLLETALTHRSALNELRRKGQKSQRESNERLEFLGDAILQKIATEFLYSHSTEQEGVLTRYRSGLVNTITLAGVAKKLNLGEKLQLSKGEEGSGGRKNPNLLADALEAVIGALHLDQGEKTAQKFILAWLEPLFEQMLAEDAFGDPKSELQELVQASHLPTPSYKILSESGPDHDKTFVVAVFVNDKEIGQGEGTSKQRAEQAAARDALSRRDAFTP